MRRFLARAIIFGLAISWLGGCNDPYSQRRIRIRLENMSELAQDIAHSEEIHARRMNEAIETVQKWWRTDTERFNRRLPTVGDYVW